MSHDIYHIENAEEIDSPALVVYAELVEQNVQQAVAMVDSRRETYLRPHVKTHKTREVVKIMRQAGIDRFKCSTIAEAEMLGREGAPDVLLAYPPTSLKATRLAKLVDTFPATSFSCLVDHPQTAEQLSGLFEQNPLPVFLDLNVGMNRTGILPQEAPSLYQYCQTLPGVEVIGLHAYDGHIRASDTQQRKREADASYGTVCQVQQRLRSDAPDSLLIVLGGSPTFPFHAQRNKVECSPGTFPLWDAGYGQAYPEMTFIPAARLLTRVVSLIDEQLLCLDLGSKAVAADAVWPRVVFPDHPEAEALRQSEEHLVVRVPDTSAVRMGDPWWGIPLHICPTVNLYETLPVVRHGRWSETWEVVARRRAITI